MFTLRPDGGPRVWPWICSWFALALFATFCLAIEQSVVVDENVFVAGAALFKSGLLPYRDFHYNHMPTLMLIDAALFGVSDHLLLTARLFNAVCAAATVTLLFTVALRSFDFLSPGRRLLWAGAAGLFFLFNPLFDYTAALAWNHDFPLLCCLGGFLTLGTSLDAAGPRRAGVLGGLAGILLGLALTARLTFAPALLPFAVRVLIAPDLPPRRRWGVLAALVGGVGVALIPSAWFWLQAPGNALFGNFVYPSLNTRWHSEHDVLRHRAFTVGARLSKTLSDLIELPAFGVLTVGFIAVAVGQLRPRQIVCDRRTGEFLSIVLLAALLFAAGFAAAPLQEQYLYAATPFMMLGLIRGLAALPHLFDLRWFKVTAAVVLVIAVAFGLDQYDGALTLLSPADWPPMQAHALGREIAARTPPGPVMTLEPLYALEGGRTILSGLSTGKFGVRAAEYLPAAERERYNMPSTAELAARFTTDPPAALLTTDAKSEDEVDLATAARLHGYGQIDLSPGRTLWLRPR